MKTHAYPACANSPGDCLRGLEWDEGGLQDGLRRDHLQGGLCAKGEHPRTPLMITTRLYNTNQGNNLSTNGHHF